MSSPDGYKGSNPPRGDGPQPLGPKDADQSPDIPGVPDAQGAEHRGSAGPQPLTAIDLDLPAALPAGLPQVPGASRAPQMPGSTDEMAVGLEATVGSEQEPDQRPASAPSPPEATTPAAATGRQDQGTAPRATQGHLAGPTPRTVFDGELPAQAANGSDLPTSHQDDEPTWGPNNGQHLAALPDQASAIGRSAAPSVRTRIDTGLPAPMGPERPHPPALEELAGTAAATPASVTAGQRAPRTEIDANLPPGVPAAPRPGAAPTEPPRLPGDEPPVISPGDRIAQYELIRELGRGGMGQVFLARDTKLGRKVAIKFLNKLSQRLTDRFLVEARSTAQCSHENIVVIHEVNELEGLPYMVLEFLDGQTMTQVMAGNRIPAGRAVELIAPVVQALVRAHEYNIVHRDLKPDNIIVMKSGTIKVLDFGIAKAMSGGEGEAETEGKRLEAELDHLAPSALTREGAIVGTMQYMSPEQWGVASVDYRTDIWATGMILCEMVAGEHPLAGMNPRQLVAAAVQTDLPLPGVGLAVPELPGDLERIIDRCLAKKKEERFESAKALLAALEPLLPSRYGRRLTEDESPYPGLTSFQEADAGRFFGRAKETTHAVNKVREQPLLGIVGPSGVGKSSFIRAGLVPALKASGTAWESLVLRPGRNPLAALARLIQPLTHTDPELDDSAAGQASLLDRLRLEPGYVGSVLRQRAERKKGSILVFVDQFEELYTLASDAKERTAFTACLAGAADDPASPVRVVVAMRLDFLDRVAEDQDFLEDLTRGLIFLQPPQRAGLREAILQPLELVGYRFEEPALVEDMLDTLENTPGALPLLQFAATKLWETRAAGRRFLTEEGFMAMGGVAGALSTHADEVVTGLSASDQNLLRRMFQQLVTSEGTRAIVDVAELLELSPNSGEVQRLVDYLVQSRLLTVQTRSEADGPAVEIVHESLITAWPLLKRWLDEEQEDKVFVEQLRQAAKQWAVKDKPQGLLWRGEAVEDARRWQRRYGSELPALQREYLDTVFRVDSRAARRKRAIIVGSFAFLLLLVAAAAASLVWIRNAEQQAKVETNRARKAEQEVKHQLEVVKQKERERKAAKSAANAAEEQVAKGQLKLKSTEKMLNMSKEDLSKALENAQAAARKAQVEERKARAAKGVADHEQRNAQKASIEARAAARRAKEAAARAKALAEQQKKTSLRLAKLLKSEQERVRRLKRKLSKIATGMLH